MSEDEPGPSQLGSALFDAEFRTAHLNGSAEIHFTRSESRLLKHLSRRPGRVFSRDELLDAISEPGSDIGDRNIDFVVNRIRRKLNDTPKTPQFIATRYGEGYIWVAWRKDETPPATGAFAVIGPVRGIAQTSGHRQAAERFTREFRSRLAQNFAKEREVVLDPNAPGLTAYGNDPPEIAVELTFLTGSTGLECLFRATDFPSGRLLCVARHRLGDGDVSPDDDQARTIALAIWESIANPPALQQPVALGMHVASAAFTGALSSWKYSLARVRMMLAAKPESAILKLMLAFCLHTKYLQTGYEFFVSDDDPRAADEDEMESALLSALPQLQELPDYTIMAAKLLYFVDRGYRNMAVDMAEGAFHGSTSPETSLAIMGHMQAHLGEIDEGLSRIELALEYAEAGSRFQAYLLALKLQILTAADMRADAAAVFAQLRDADHGATAELVHLYIAARLYREEEHRANLLRGPALLLAKRFGPDVVPNEFAQAVPTLFREIADALKD